MSYERFSGMELYNQVLIAALAVLLVVFLGMILLQLIGYSLSVIGAKADTPRSTRIGISTV